MNLAPVADVVSDPASFLYERTYGDDPGVVADYVGAVSGAYLRSGLICVVKHFPGHGSASGDTHRGPVISEATQTDFATTHLPPFKAAIETGVEALLVGHLVAAAYDPDHPASLSSTVVQGLLREDLGFSGLVVADDLEMAAVAGPSEARGTAADDPAATADARRTAAGDIGEIAVAALQAGCDLLISTGAPDRQRQMTDSIVAAVEAGRLSRDRLDSAVLHVLDLKCRHHLTAF